MAITQQHLRNQVLRDLGAAPTIQTRYHGISDHIYSQNWVNLWVNTTFLLKLIQFEALCLKKVTMWHHNEWLQPPLGTRYTAAWVWHQPSTLGTIRYIITFLFLCLEIHYVTRKSVAAATPGNQVHRDLGMAPTIQNSYHGISDHIYSQNWVNLPINT